MSDLLYKVMAEVEKGGHFAWELNTYFYMGSKPCDSLEDAKQIAEMVRNCFGHEFDNVWIESKPKDDYLWTRLEEDE